MAEPPAERRSPINTIGASAAVAVLGAVVVWWAYQARSAAGVVGGAGILVLAAGGVGAGAGLRRRRVVRGAAIGATLGLVLAVVAVGALVAHGRSVDVGGDHRVEIDQPFAGIRYAWALDDGTVVALTDDTLLTVADDGTTTAGPETAAGTPFLVPHGGDAVGGVVTSGLDDEVVLRDAAGELVWRTALAVDDQPATRIEVAAADAEGRVAVQACIERRCALVGLDPEGREIWRRAADEVDLGVGAVVVDVPSDPDLRAAPPRLVVVGTAGGPAVEVDLATGDETELGAGGLVAVVGDTVTIFRLEGERCEVGIVRGGDDEETVEVPCRGGGLVSPTPTRSVVVQRQWDGAVAVATETGEVGSVEVGGGETIVTGDGVLVEKTRSSTQLRRVVQDEALATYDGWNMVAAGPDGLVLDRDRESGNPFAPERLREVAVVDPDTGEMCARLRLDTTFVSRASPLPGCRALLDPSEGPDLLVGGD